jgi:hypothetical protein
MYRWPVLNIMIILQSLKTLNSAYHCEWHTVNSKFRKHLHILMERAKSPVKLTAGGFSTLTLESFTRVCTVGIVQSLKWLALGRSVVSSLHDHGVLTQSRDDTCRWLNVLLSWVSESHTSDYKKYSLLCYKDMWFGDNPIFWRNIWPWSSRSKSMPGKSQQKQVASWADLPACLCWLLPGLLFDPKIGGNMSPWNIRFSLNYTVLQPKRP